MNKKISKSLQKILQRRMLFNKEISNLQHKYNSYNHTNSNSIFKVNFQNSKKWIQKNREQKLYSQSSVDQILKEIIKQYQSKLQKKICVKKVKTYDQRVSKNHKSVRKHQQEYLKKNKSNISTRFSTFRKLKLNRQQQMQDLSFQSKKYKRNTNFQEQKRYKSHSVKTENSMQQIKNITKLYRRAETTRKHRFNIKFL